MRKVYYIILFFLAFARTVLAHVLCSVTHKKGDYRLQCAYTTASPAAGPACTSVAASTRQNGDRRLPCAYPAASPAAGATCAPFAATTARPRLARATAPAFRLCIVFVGAIWGMLLRWHRLLRRRRPDGRYSRAPSARGYLIRPKMIARHLDDPVVEVLASAAPCLVPVGRLVAGRAYEP